MDPPSISNEILQTTVKVPSAQSLNGSSANRNADNTTPVVNKKKKPKRSKEARARRHAKWQNRMVELEASRLFNRQAAVSAAVLLKKEKSEARKAKRPAWTDPKGTSSAPLRVAKPKGNKAKAGGHVKKGVSYTLAASVKEQAPRRQAPSASATATLVALPDLEEKRMVSSGPCEIVFPLDLTSLAALNQAVAVGEVSKEVGVERARVILMDTPPLIAAAAELQAGNKHQLAHPVSWASGLRLDGLIPVHAVPIQPGMLAQVLELPGVTFRTVGHFTSTITCVLSALTAAIVNDAPGAVFIGVGISDTWGVNHVIRPVSGAWDIGGDSCTSCVCKGATCEHVASLMDSKVKVVYILGPGFKGDASKYLSTGSVCMISVGGPLISSTKGHVAVKGEAMQPYVRNTWWNGRTPLLSGKKLTGTSFGCGTVYQFTGKGNFMLASGSAMDMLEFAWPEEVLMPEGIVASASSVDVCKTLVDRVAAASFGRVGGDLTERLVKRTAVRLVESGEFPLFSSECNTVHAACELAARYTDLTPVKFIGFNRTTWLIRTAINLVKPVSIGFGVLATLCGLWILTPPLRVDFGNLLRQSVGVGGMLVARLDHPKIHRLAPGSAFGDKSVESLVPSRPFPERLFWVAAEEAFKRSPFHIGTVLLSGFEFVSWWRLSSLREALVIYGPTMCMHFVWAWMSPLNGFLFHAAWNEYIYSAGLKSPPTVARLRRDGDRLHPDK